MAAEASPDRRRRSRRVAYASGALWLISLALPAIAAHDPLFENLPGEPLGRTIWSPGWQVALGGFMGPLAGIVAWYANIPWLVGIVRLLRGRAASDLMLWWVAAALLAITVLIPVNNLPFDEGDWSGRMLRGPGCWLWLAAVLLPLAASFWDERPRATNAA